MTPQSLTEMLERVRAGEMAVPDAVQLLRDVATEDLGFARLDHHRPLRTGDAEVVLGTGKTPGQIAQICKSFLAKNGRVLVTKVDPAAVMHVMEEVDGLTHEVGLLYGGEMPEPRREWGVAVLSAGTADLPIAKEAELTARYYGCAVATHFDVGVAGLHRTLGAQRQIGDARAVIVAAGMDGALPSVMAGLLSCPVIAVPTSVGYGASFEGLAALLTMLNCCAPGVAVVNIDNGFGAGYVAYQIARGEG